MRAREQIMGQIGAHPADLVDLVVRRELSALSLHRPVPHSPCSALSIGVADLWKLEPDHACEAGLLGNLANGTLESRFTRLESTLRERPVMVHPPMDQQHLHAAGRTTRASPHETPGGLDRH